MTPHAHGPPEGGVQSSRRAGDAKSTLGCPPSSRLNHASTPGGPEDDETYDLIGVGFGPSNLTLAIALHDALEVRTPGGRTPRVLFLERQEDFGWHRGMLLPGTKMQISFIKDLATMRNPRSHFTFLNYLHVKGRLASFTNLGTFLPSRHEYEDYMRWCADHFTDVVRYGQQVTGIVPADGGSSAPVRAFSVRARDVRSDSTRTITGKNVVIAAGGAAFVPPCLRFGSPRIIHSSSYVTRIHEILPKRSAPYTIAVVGGGQSAAEIFNDLRSRLPQSKVRLILRGAALRPSDDSPLYAASPTCSCLCGPIAADSETA